jgi:hypothetical protein
MSNLSIALAMILAVETPNMDTQAIGDLHLPEARRAIGRFQIRKPVIDDLNMWRKHGAGYEWTRQDSMNPQLDVLMAAYWLRVRAGEDATVKRYLSTWNGGRQGRNSPQAQDYVKRAYRVRAARPEHYAKCVKEIRRFGI